MCRWDDSKLLPVGVWRLRRCQRNSVSGVTSHPARLGRGSAAAIAPSKLRSASVSSGRSTCPFERPKRTAKRERHQQPVQNATHGFPGCSASFLVSAQDHILGTHTLPTFPRSLLFSRLGLSASAGSRSRRQRRRRPRARPMSVTRSRCRRSRRDRSGAAPARSDETGRAQLLRGPFGLLRRGRLAGAGLQLRGILVLVRGFRRDRRRLVGELCLVRPRCGLPTSQRNYPIYVGGPGLDVGVQMRRQRRRRANRRRLGAWPRSGATGR